MKNQMWVWVILVIIVLGAYMYRGQLRSMFMGGSYAPATQTALVSPAPSTSESVSQLVIVKTDAAKGDYLTDTRGMTLYTKDSDTAGVSTCTDTCATLWPPYTTTTVPATLPENVTTLTRADGTIQYAYKSMPVYYYTTDTVPGDVTGDGVGGVWHLVKP